MILFETLNQPTILLYLIVGGFLCGLLFDLTNFICFLCNNNKIVKNIFQFFATTLSAIILLLINTKQNFGQLRLYVFVFFILFLILERITLGKLIAKSMNVCYTFFRKVINKLLKVKLWKKNKRKHLKQD